jgi:GMP reductase
MRIISDTKLDFNDVLLVPRRSNIESREQVNLVRKFETRNGKKFEGIPIIAANMATGNYNMLKALAEHKMFTAVAKHHNQIWFECGGLNEKLLYGFYTLGIKNPEELEELRKFYRYIKFDEKIPITPKIIIDIANGYMQKFSDFVKEVRDVCPESIIFAGNVCTPEMTEQLIIAGADGVKIGIGPGSFCRTRMVAGVGYPQLSAIMECADTAHGLDGLVIADGGCRNPGDVAKAFCANADFVMLGTMFAGTDECDGDLITKYIHTGEYKPNRYQSPVCQASPYEPIIKEKQFKIFYGMASDKAAKDHFGGVKNYKASEGLVEEVEYKGPVDIQVRNVLGGLRSACSYIGATQIKNMGKCGLFAKVNRIH